MNRKRSSEFSNYSGGAAKASALKQKQKPAFKLNQTSNFSLNPKDRCHEMNSFFDTFTKLGQMKQRLNPKENSNTVSRNFQYNSIQPKKSTDKHIPLLLQIENVEDALHDSGISLQVRSPRVANQSQFKTVRISPHASTGFLVPPKTVVQEAREEGNQTSTTEDRQNMSPSPKLHFSPSKIASLNQKHIIKKKLETITTTRSFFDSNKLYIKSIQDYQTGHKQRKVQVM